MQYQLQYREYPILEPLYHCSASQYSADDRKQTDFLHHKEHKTTLDKILSFFKALNHPGLLYIALFYFNKTSQIP